MSGILFYSPVLVCVKVIIKHLGPKVLMPCAYNCLFQGARGNDGLPGPAGPPVSIIFSLI